MVIASLSNIEIFTFFFSVVMIMSILIKDGRVEKLLVRETAFPMLIVTIFLDEF